MYTLIIKQIKNDILKEIKATNYITLDDAYSAFRNKIKEYGLNKNDIFDGNGSIRQLNKYVKNYLKSISEYKTEDWCIKHINEINKSMALFSGIILNSDNVSTRNISWTDAIVKCKYNNGLFSLAYTEEGAANGVLPLIKTNILKPSQNHYYFYIRDDFELSDSVNELYMDLVETHRF